MKQIILAAVASAGFLTIMGCADREPRTTSTTTEETSVQRPAGDTTTTTETHAVQPANY